MAKANRLGLEGPELRMGCQQVFSGTWRAQLMSDTGNPGMSGHRGPPGPVLVPQLCCPRATLGSRQEPPPTQTETPVDPRAMFSDSIHSLLHFLKDSGQVACPVRLKGQEEHPSPTCSFLIPQPLSCSRAAVTWLMALCWHLCPVWDAWPGFMTRPFPCPQNRDPGGVAIFLL